MTPEEADTMEIGTEVIFTSYRADRDYTGRGYFAGRGVHRSFCLIQTAAYEDLQMSHLYTVHPVPFLDLVAEAAK